MVIFSLSEHVGSSSSEKGRPGSSCQQLGLVRQSQSFRGYETRFVLCQLLIEYKRLTKFATEWVSGVYIPRARHM